jgi:hypothetical protein
MKASLFSVLFLFAFASTCAASDISITTTSIPNGTVDTDYSATIQASGGCTPYKWKLLTGKLPTGVTQTPSSNTTSLDLSGDPTTEATYAFTESVTSCDGTSVAYAWFQVVIQASAIHIVNLQWNASTSNDIAGYNVYRGPDGVTWAKMNSGLIANTDYTDSTVANGSTYYYSATTVNIEGEESKKSASVKVSIP